MIQKICEKIGNFGCYLSCLLHYAKIEDDIVKYYKLFLKNDWIDEDCYIKQPLEIMHCLTGHTYRMVKSEVADPNATFSVYYWYNPKTKLHHFTCAGFDPLGASNTVRDGYIESYRHFYYIGG